MKQHPVSSVEWVDRARLRANTYNPNHVAPLELQLLRTSLLEDGWTQPIVVLPDGVTIVDGFHRWSVAADPEVAAMTGGQVPIVRLAGEVSTLRRVAATIRHNRARGEHGVRPMVAIVRGLLQEGVPEAAIQRALGMEPEEVERLSDLRQNPAVFGDAAGGYSEAWQPELAAPEATGNRRPRAK